MATLQSAIVLPELPYARGALEPYMSRETLDYHYGKHHKTYVEKVNELIQGTEFEDSSLEELVTHATGTLFSQALESFGGLESFQKQFDKAAVEVFGSGWAWLVRDGAGAVKIITSADANTPERDGHTALLTCDMWEHAYYIDHRNERPAYMKSFWSLVNWDFVTANLEE
jgi:superoxide dismutase, Fe-Mn family